MAKKLLVSIVILQMLFFTVYTPPATATDTFTVDQKILIGTALVLGGVTYTNTQAVTDAVNHFITVAPSVCQNIVNASTMGTLALTAGLYAEVKSFVSANYTSGSVQTLNVTGEEQQIVTGTTYESITGKQISYSCDGRVYATVDGRLFTNSTNINSIGVAGMKFVYDDYYGVYYFQAQSITDPPYRQMWGNTTTWPCYLSPSYDNQISGYTGVPIIGQSIVDADYTSSSVVDDAISIDGDNTINIVPPVVIDSTDDLVDITDDVVIEEWVDDDPVVPPIDITYDMLRNSVDGISIDYENNRIVPWPLPSTVAVGNTTATLEWDWSDSQIYDGALVTGVTAAILTVLARCGEIEYSRTYEISETGVIEPPPSGPVNWQRLKMIPTIFTTKFPFSLPWDILYQFNQLLAPRVAPDFKIDFTSSILGHVEIPIPWDLWADVVPIVRAIELFIFDLALIMSTRKLMGGDV